MTNDQKSALDYLEDAIYSPRQKGRLDAIRQAFQDYKLTLYKPPWYKRIFKTRHL